MLGRRSTKSGTPWTPAEFRRMWKLKKQGLTNTAISRQIHRSPAAIAAMVRETHDYT